MENVDNRSIGMCSLTLITSLLHAITQSDVLIVLNIFCVGSTVLYNIVKVVKEIKPKNPKP